MRRTLRAQEVKVCQSNDHCQTTRTRDHTDVEPFTPLVYVLETTPPQMTQFERHNTWTEDMLDGLAPHEHDFQEFKGSGWLMRTPSDVQPDFLFFLSKQASAFANGSGGSLFVGIDDDGRIDGGVPIDIKGGTRAWLEDLVATSVDPPLPRCNVFEVSPREGATTKIKVGHGVYVIELPGSPEAPHQAKDHRYYLRIAGKSRPMGHVHVQDVLRRTFHPQIALARFGPYGSFEKDTQDPRGPRAFIQFRLFLQIVVVRLARHVGLEAIVPRPLAGSEVRKRMKALKEAHYTQNSWCADLFQVSPNPHVPEPRGLRPERVGVFTQEQRSASCPRLRDRMGHLCRRCETSAGCPSPERFSNRQARGELARRAQTQRRRVNLTATLAEVDDRL